MHLNASTILFFLIICLYKVTDIYGCHVEVDRNNLVLVNVRTYGFLSENTAIIGEKESIFWVSRLQRNQDITVEIKAIGNRQRNPFVYFGSGTSGCSLHSNNVITSTCMCQPRFSDYVPIKAWSTEGPVELKFKRGTDYLKIYLHANEIKTVNQCPNAQELDGIVENYKDLKKYKRTRTNFIDLTTNETVIWAPVADLDHYLSIAVRYSKKYAKREKIEVEANGGIEFQNFTQIQYSLNIFFDNKSCQPSFHFFGYVRYIIKVEDTDMFKVGIINKLGNDNTAVQLYYLERELLSLDTDTFKTFYIEPSAQTSPKPSTSVSDVSTSTSTAISSILTSSETSSTVIQTSTTTASSSTTLNDTSAEEDKPYDYPTSLPLKSSTKSEESGLALEILIPVIIGSLLILLIIICITVICIIRCVRRRKRKNAKNQNRGKQSSQKRSAIKSAFITLVGEEAEEEEGETKSIQNGSSLQQYPSSLKSNADQILLPSTTDQIPSTIPVSSNLVPSKEKASSKKPDQMLPLQQTQSVKESEHSSNTFSQTARAAKKAKRDPRFPHLIPGTIEFLVVESQFIEQDSSKFQRSGTIDDSKHAQFINE